MRIRMRDDVVVVGVVRRVRQLSYLIAKADAANVLLNVRVIKL